MTSKRFRPYQKFHDFMTVDPILLKEKPGLQKSHSTNMWQSRTWNGGVLTWSLLIVSPHCAKQPMNLSKQEKNKLLPFVETSGCSP